MQVRTFTYTLRSGEYWAEDGYMKMDDQVQRLLGGGWELLNSTSDTGHMRVGKTLAVGALTGGLSLLFGGSRTAKTITLTFKTDRPAPEPVPAAPQAGIGVVGWVLIFLVILVMAGIVYTSQSGTAHTDNPVSAHAAPAPPDPNVTVMADTKVASYCYSGSVLLCDFTVSNNNSDFFIKDIEITCKAFGKSGTEIDSNKRTIYDKVESNSKKRFPKFNMGFVHSQAVSSSCWISKLETGY